MTTAVFFTTRHGATKRYAQEFATRAGLSAPVELADDQKLSIPADHFTAGDTVVVFSPNYGGQIAGSDAISADLLGTGARVALVTVGMSEIDWVKAKDPAAKSLGKKAHRVTRFYLPGALIFSRLSAVAKAALWSIHGMIKAKPNKNANDQLFLANFGKDIDNVDFALLDEIDRWVSVPTSSD